MFHATLLSLRPPSDLIEDEEQWEVEAIIGHKKWGRGHRYLVKWTGYPTSKNTWQSAEDLKDASEILSDYQQLHHL